MRWISFAQADALSRSVVHILPTTRGGIAAQPVMCSITLFADRPEQAEVSIEGMRLNQPDGIRLEEAFPRLKEGGNSLIGVAVDLEPSQQKGDLRNSVCAIEILSRTHVVRFPMPLREEPRTRREGIPVIADRATQTSLVFANQGARYAEVQLSPVGGGNHPMNISVAPHSVSEYSLSSLTGSSATSFHCSWGEVVLGSAVMTSELPVEIAGFIVYREAGSQRITSVVSL